MTGKRCRWCNRHAHNKCLGALPDACDLGELKYHILPPTHVFPAFLERKTSTKAPHVSNLLQVQPFS